MTPDAVKYFLGCDPDLHTTAWACVDENYRIVFVSVSRANGATEQDAVIAMCRMIRMNGIATTVAAAAVEAQELYQSGPHKTKNPRNILHLGHVAGACLHQVTQPNVDLYFPTPAQWKGQIDKLPHHRRILQRAGIPDRNMVQQGGKDSYMVCTVQVPGSASLNPGDWKHVNDAIGLAQWAAERHKYETTKQQLLAQARSS